MIIDRDLPEFETRHLASAIEALPGDIVDRLPFGVIRIGNDGRVEYYSATERRLSGSGDRDRVGLDFFARIAPCMDNPEFRGRVERARAAGTLDLEFSHVGDFEDRDREMSIRIQSASSGGYWMFLRRD
ncbi:MULTISPECIES: PAS domain-containing protein [unclassified Sphingomonas]|uniref:PAS domain-containing protein n=1 Tax=unclassified Sphingomonas TaxID=196159 RepID=UPI001F581461|nr:MULTISPECIES: PAS domain-containing protein [unclassified Sphingomonas]